MAKLETSWDDQINNTILPLLQFTDTSILSYNVSNVCTLVLLTPELCWEPNKLFAFSSLLCRISFILLLNQRVLHISQQNFYQKFLVKKSSVLMQYRHGHLTSNLTWYLITIWCHTNWSVKYDNFTGKCNEKHNFVLNLSLKYLLNNNTFSYRVFTVLLELKGWFPVAVSSTHILPQLPLPMDGIIFGLTSLNHYTSHYDSSDAELPTLMTAFRLVPKHFLFVLLSIGHLWTHWSIRGIIFWWFISYSIYFQAPTFKKH